jgi:hypothetical protein
MLLNRRRVMWDLPRPDNNTLDGWCRLLVDVDPIKAFAVLDQLVQTEAKPPSPARIITEIRGPERRIIPVTERPLPPPPAEDEKVRGRAIIAEIRSKLRHPSNRQPDGAA